MNTDVKTRKTHSTLEEFLTIQEARERLRCSRTTIYNLIKSGEIHKYKLQAGSRLSARELQDYMERQKQLK